MSGVIAVLGFGEAGSLIARDLVRAGAAVRGYDPAVPAVTRSRAISEPASPNPRTAMTPLISGSAGPRRP